MSGSVRVLLLDIGGVILTKGWGGDSRQQAAEQFSYDAEPAENRHRGQGIGARE